MADVLQRAAGTRQGLIEAPVLIPLTASDPTGIFHASVADEGFSARHDEHALDHSGEAPASPLTSAGGGVGRSQDAATTAATAEALERYAASIVELDTKQRGDIEEDAAALELGEWTLHHPDQVAHPQFPDRSSYQPEPVYTPVHNTADNSLCWVPASLVALRRDYGTIATSSGLAADFCPSKALLRAVQEIVERDAYVTTWLHGLAGRPVPAPGLEADVDGVDGEVVAYDITPAYSPHPVACVAGSIPLRGRPRNSLGLACRATWDEAVDKAFLEFVQGTMFVGHQLTRAPELEELQPQTCTGFDQHAVFWTVHSDAWWQLPLHAERHGPPHEPPRPTETSSSRSPTTARELEALITALTDKGIRLLYRRLGVAGLDQIGLTVVRALSPDLVPLHHNHNWPFLGGTAADVTARYPDRTRHAPFPSRHPHALG